MSKATRVATIVCVVAAMSAAHADPSSGPDFSLRGFATVGASYSDNERADFSSTVFHKTGAGGSNSWSGDVDTKLGVQIDAQFTPELSGVLQIVTQQNYANSYEPAIEWANVSYAITPDLIVRGGRIMWPLLLRSETQNVGYGNPFVRNTTEHLANMPNTFNDGVDITWRFPLGEGINSVQLLYGNSDVNYPGAGPLMGQNYLNLRRTRGISDVFEIGDWKVHAAFMRLKYDWLYFDFELEEVPYDTWTLGFNYDPGQWYVTSDYLKAVDRDYGDFTALMVGGGYRLGQFTPYAFHSFLRQDRLGDLGSFGTYSGDKQTVNAIGVRWDFRQKMDMKLQYEEVRSGAISQIFPSSLTNWQSSFLDDPNPNVFSVVFDFVF